MGKSKHETSAEEQDLETRRRVKQAEEVLTERFAAEAENNNPPNTSG